MNIEINNKKLGIYKRIWRQSRTIQDSVEASVNANQPGIEKVVTVFSDALLKSKDIMSRTVTVGGEIRASVMYIANGGDGVFTVDLSAPFNAEFDTGSDSQGFATAVVSVRRLEAHVLDERRILLSFEAQIDAEYYEQSEFIVGSSVEEEKGLVVHTLYDNVEAVNTVNFSERTFALSEQYDFSDVMAPPKTILWADAALKVQDTQIIGSKAIVKGSAETELIYLSEDSPLPIRTQFSSPFSQIVELGTENATEAITLAQLSSRYYNLVDTVGGDLALDAEIHGVLQVRALTKTQISLIKDAYCNSFPLELKQEDRKIVVNETEVEISLSSEQIVEAGDNIAEIIAAYPSPAQLNIKGEGVNVSVPLDILYLGDNGTLSSIRRSISFDGTIPEGAVVYGTSFGEVSVLAQNGELKSRLDAIVAYMKNDEQSISEVIAINCADEPSRYNKSKPSLYLVRRGSESLWNIAKSYNSSVESIEQANQGRDSAAGYLIVPRAI